MHIGRSEPRALRPHLLQPVPDAGAEALRRRSAPALLRLGPQRLPARLPGRGGAVRVRGQFRARRALRDRAGPGGCVTLGPGPARTTRRPDAKSGEQNRRYAGRIFVHVYSSSSSLCFISHIFIGIYSYANG